MRSDTYDDNHNSDMAHGTVRCSPPEPPSWAPQAAATTGGCSNSLSVRVGAFMRLPQQPAVPGGIQLEFARPAPRAVLTLSLPASASGANGGPAPSDGWRRLPTNPLIGVAVPAEEIAKEDYRHYCDSCQRGFHSSGAFDAHMADHLYCDVPGCGFTCRKDKSWKLDIHKETLHNRIGSPNLENVDSYLAQRRMRFPTKEAVTNKVEELFYRAARGEVLPGERRRWLRQHGVVAPKHAGGAVRTTQPLPSQAAAEAAEFQPAYSSQQRQDPPNCNPGNADAPSPATGAVGEQFDFEDDESKSIVLAADLPPPRRIPARAALRGDALLRLNPSRVAEGSSVGRHVPVISSSPPTPQEMADGAPPSVIAAAASSAAAHRLTSAASGGHHQTSGSHQHQHPHVVPLGLNGRFTRAQLVQMVRDKYHASTVVPKFYVCNHCGVKGQHWVEECPRRGDAAYRTRHEWGEQSVWMQQRGGSNTSASGGSCAGGPAASQGRELSVSEAAPPPAEADLSESEGSDTSSTATSPRSTSPASVAPLPATPHPSVSSAAVVPPPTTPSPLLPEPLAGSQSIVAGEGSGMGEVASRRRRPRLPPSHPLSLYDRLTEDQRLQETGLLLQALRYFVHEGFFDAPNQAI